MMFRFIKLSLKKAISRSERSDSDLKNIPSAVRKSLDAKRSSCISKFEAISKGFEKGSKHRDAQWQTTEGRETMTNDIVESVNSYEAEAASVLFEYPAFATGYYYRWSSSLSENADIVFDDFRYDLQCMYFNIAAILMNIAEYLLGWQMTPSTTSMLEKESYRFLLQAAGYFFLLKEMAQDVKAYCVGATDLERPEDILSGFMDFFRLIALAEAQEIGTSKAAENEVSGGKSLVAKLSHQIFKLYKEALEVAKKNIVSTKSEYMDILSFIQLKVDVFGAMTFCHTSSSVFDNNPSEGLWFVSQSDIYGKAVVNHRDRARKKRKHLPFRGDDVIQFCCDTLRRNSERCTRINSLVHRAKPAEGPLTLPPPYELAQMKEVKLPAKFPHQIPQPPPPPPETT